jgi:hypothetical protein
MEQEELWWRKKLQELQEAMILNPLLLEVPNLIEWLLDSICASSHLHHHRSGFLAKDEFSMQIL